MRITVTGALGFIGTQIVSSLIAQGHEVVACDSYDTLIRSYEENRYPILERIYANIKKCADLITPRRLLDYGENSCLTIHAGACVDTTDMGSPTLWENNVDYVRALCHQLSANPTNSLIFISSAATYGRWGYPNNPYGLSKVMGENIVRDSRINAVILRLYNVFGEFEHHKGAMASVPWKLAQAYRTGLPFKLHSASAKRDFVPVEAVASAVVTFAKRSITGQMTYDVGTGHATSFADLNEMINAATGRAHHNVTVTDETPADLAGRFQTYTCAGEMVNVGTGFDTKQYIEKYYGKQSDRT